MRVVNYPETYSVGREQKTRHHVDVFEGRNKVINKCKVFPTPAAALAYTRSLMETPEKGKEKGK